MESYGVKRKHPEQTLIFWWEMLITWYIILLILGQNWITHVVVPTHRNTQGSKKVDVHCGTCSVIHWGNCTVLVSLISKQNYSRNHRVSGWKAPSKLRTPRHQTRKKSKWPTVPLPSPAEEQGRRIRGMKRKEQLSPCSRFPAEVVKDWRPWGAVCLTWMSMIRYLYLKNSQTKQKNT